MQEVMNKSLVTGAAGFIGTVIFLDLFTGAKFVGVDALEDVLFADEDTFAGGTGGAVPVICTLVS